MGEANVRFVCLADGKLDKRSIDSISPKGDGTFDLLDKGGNVIARDCTAKSVRNKKEESLF